MKVEIYTDGSCLGNPGPGGWGAILKYGKTEKELSGGVENTTNNRMELLAVIEALSALTRTCTVVLTSDSAYVRNGITIWIYNWEKNGWKNSAKQPVKNKDLWLKLKALQQKHSIEWLWVKGHSGHIENERVDVLARLAAEKIKDQL